jgi:hypothetical protein
MHLKKHQIMKEIATELFSAANLLRMKVIRNYGMIQYLKQVTTFGNFQIGALSSEQKNRIKNQT